VECIPTRSVGTIGNGIGNRGFDGCADPVGAGLLANTVGLAGRWRLTECVRQQAGSYSRLHSASETNADGEIGVSREWTRSVMECISTRSVGTIKGRSRADQGQIKGRSRADQRQIKGRSTASRLKPVPQDTVHSVGSGFSREEARLFVLVCGIMIDAFPAEAGPTGHRVHSVGPALAGKPLLCFALLCFALLCF